MASSSKNMLPPSAAARWSPDLPGAYEPHAFPFATVVLFALVLGLLQSTPASAYTQRTKGQPGGVYAYKIQGSHFNGCEGRLYTCFSPWVVGTGPVVYRSRASRRRQVIAIAYQLWWRNDSAWVKWNERIHHRVLYPGYSRIQMPRVDFLPNRGGYFKVIILVHWQGLRRALGTRVLNYNERGDYVCNTRFPCATGGGWVWLRSPGV